MGGFVNCGSSKSHYIIQPLDKSEKRDTVLQSFTRSKCQLRMFSFYLMFDLKIIYNFSLLNSISPFDYLTIILRNRAEYHLILSRRGRRPSWLNQGIFRKIEQDNCFIIQQILIDYIFITRKTMVL